MPRRVAPEKWLHYNNLRKLGMSAEAAAIEANISPNTARSYEKGSTSSSGSKLRAALKDVDLPDPIPMDELSRHAAEALNDFAKFRRMFFGHVSLPWHEEAAEIILRAHESPDREYVILNTPPEAGKTTLVSHDIACWLIVRNRRIRLLMGSAVEALAKVNVERLRRTLENRYLVRAQEFDIKHGLAVDATHNLIEEYGRFKPLFPDLWTTKQFIVAQHIDIALNQKEPTVTAFGMDSGSIGWRVDDALWDDLSDKNTMATIESAAKQFRWFDTEAEKRINLNGAFILYGQRLGPRDIYKHAKEKRSGVDDDESLDDWDDDEDLHGIDPATWEQVDIEMAAPPKYRHIMFQAHDESKCKGRETHRRDAAPQPIGCLLDPKRLNWKYLSAELREDKQVFDTVYQQKDVDDNETLINELILSGGTDTVLNEEYPGNMNNNRALLQPPEIQKGRVYSVVCSDPSGTNFWAIQWWLWHPRSGKRYLMNIYRKKMTASAFLDRNGMTSDFEGIMEDMWNQSVDLGFPIKYWIYEIAATQRFFNQMNAVRDWLRYREVQLIKQETNINKIDPKYGVSVLRNKYKAGLYDLPNAAIPGTRRQVKYLTDELLTHPDGTSDDEVMANWFLEKFIQRREKREQRDQEGNKIMHQRRPSWVADPNTQPTESHNFPMHDSQHLPTHIKPSAVRSRMPQFQIGRGR